jgi:hypothetical protein
MPSKQRTVVRGGNSLGAIIELRRTSGETGGALDHTKPVLKLEVKLLLPFFRSSPKKSHHAPLE